MACTKEELTVGGRNVTPPPDARVSVGDTLLLATMYMIGMPVDVQARDGSVYSGIFHTASLDDNYAIVLRKAMLLKKGDLVANVLADTLIETLVIGAEDFVQVVVKGDVFSSAEITRFLSNDGLKLAEACKESLDTGSEVVETIMPRSENGVTCFSVARETNVLGASLGDPGNRFDMMNIVKTDATQNFSINERKEVDHVDAVDEGHENDPVLGDMARTDEVQVPNSNGSSSDSQSDDVQIIIHNSVHQKPEDVFSDISKAEHDQSNEKLGTDDVAAADSKITDFIASDPDPLMPSKDSSREKSSKSSKLNPGAKTFSPSAMYHRTNPTNFAYVPISSYTATSLVAQDEVDASSFAPSSVPIKYFPYSTLNDATYIHPIFSQIGNRGLHSRYIGQYQSVQSGTPYIHPSTQNIAYGNGRIGPVVFMHSVSGDPVPSAVGFSPAVVPRPILNTNQAHISKHLRTSSPQAVQVTMPPGQLQFLTPAPIPLPQAFPVSYPVTVPGQMGS